jgi:hypothetical protein
LRRQATRLARRELRRRRLDNETIVDDAVAV